MTHSSNRSSHHFLPRFGDGQGIICGLEWYTEDNCTLRLCGGTGITSAGLPIQTKKADYHFTHCRPFNAPDYPLFSLDGQKLSVWELLEGNPAGDHNGEVKPLTPQNEIEQQNLRLSEKVIVVYLESSTEQAPEEEEENPGEAAYDDYTSPETHDTRLRFLLMDQADVIRHLGLVERISQRQRDRQDEDEDYIYGEDYATDDDLIQEMDIRRAADSRLDWPEISLGRFGFGCLDAFDCEPGDLELSDFPTQGAGLNDLYTRYVCIIDRATVDLDRAIRQVQNWLIDNCYCFENPDWVVWLDMLCTKWEAYKALNQVRDDKQHKKEFVQYFYDWCRDLIKAYHELREAVICWSATCHFNAEEHPRHLFVGLAMRRPATYFPPAFRHVFRSPPSFHDAAKLKEKIRVAHYRILLMIQAFYLPNAIPDDAVNPFCAAEREGNIEELPVMDKLRLTPGRYYDQPLGQQSIPFYYPLTDDSLSLHHFWSPSRAAELTTERHRSYHATPEEGGYSTLPQVTHPFRFNIDEDDFIRVEGHIGQPINTILSSPEMDGTVTTDVFREFRERYNLTFEVRSVELAQLFTSENYFITQFQGAEHLAGVRPGGTLVLVTAKRYLRDPENVIVADFSLPYRCCPEEDKDSGNGRSTTTGQAEKIMAETAKVISTTENLATVEKALELYQPNVESTYTALHSSIKNSSSLLKAEIEMARVEDKRILVDTTKLVTLNYLEKASIKTPDKLTPGSIKALKVVAKEHPEIDFAKEVKTWYEAKGDTLSTELVADLKKLKFD